ncbi:hypothetical protein [Cupriavidus sp. 8B]
MADEQSVIVIELAKEFMELIRQIAPAWSRAYFRFCLEGSKHGSNGSYVIDSKVDIIDPFTHNAFFRGMNEKAMQLLALLSKDQAVLLLVIDSTFNYDIKFEYQNLDRWRITKANGGSGVPEGI